MTELLDRKDYRVVSDGGMYLSIQREVQAVTMATDADLALDTVFELRPVAQQELFRVVDSLRARSAPTYDQASLHLMRIKNGFKHNVLSVNVDETRHLPYFMKNDPGPRTVKTLFCVDHRAIACDCGTIELKLGTTRPLCEKKLRTMIYAFVQLAQVLYGGQCSEVYFYVQSMLQYGILAWKAVS
ncbi:hypothetical protein J6590_030077 [Homalodisca vitripennis]|nr:hypothetical protein J6590_030077 [Homalodisca vitripennis]